MSLNELSRETPFLLSLCMSEHVHGSRPDASWEKDSQSKERLTDSSLSIKTITRHCTAVTSSSQARRRKPKGVTMPAEHSRSHNPLLPRIQPGLGFAAL